MGTDPETSDATLPRGAAKAENADTKAERHSKLASNRRITKHPVRTSNPAAIG